MFVSHTHQSPAGATATLSLHTVLADCGEGVSAVLSPLLGSVWHAEMLNQSNADVLVSMPVLLAAHGGVWEHWRAAGEMREGSLGLARYRCSDELMFVAVQICEQEQSKDRDIATTAQQAYTALFEAIAAEGFGYLARCWNYFSDINAEQAGTSGSLERYRLFNIGRQAAFESTGHAGAPAACALGTASGPLTVYALAVRTAPLWIENPRQISAYDYPQRYGPQSPTFSRGSVIKHEQGATLFVSGTASIVGHESVHIGDVVAQTEESLRNIVTVVTQANLGLACNMFSATKLCYKVFVRRAEDALVVADTIRRELGASVPMIFLRADVCRAELLVEIEAVGFA